MCIWLLFAISIWRTGRRGALNGSFGCDFEAFVDFFATATYTTVDFKFRKIEQSSTRCVEMVQNMGSTLHNVLDPICAYGPLAFDGMHQHTRRLCGAHFTLGTIFQHLF